MTKYSKSIQYLSGYRKNIRVKVSKMYLELQEAWFTVSVM